MRGSRLVPNVAWLKGVRPIVWPEGSGGGTETFLPGFFEDIAMTHRILLILIALALVLSAGTLPASAAQFRPLLPDTSRDTDPAPSPDGKWLAYQSNKGGSSQIWIIPAGGGAPRKVTSEPATTKAPATINQSHAWCSSPCPPRLTAPAGRYRHRRRSPRPGSERRGR